MDRAAKSVMRGRRVGGDSGEPDEAQRRRCPGDGAVHDLDARPAKPPGHFGRCGCIHASEARQHLAGTPDPLAQRDSEPIPCARRPRRRQGIVAASNSGDTGPFDVLERLTN